MGSAIVGVTMNAIRLGTVKYDDRAGVHCCPPGPAASMCRPNCLPRSWRLTSQKMTQRVAKAVDPSATVVEVQHPPVTLSMSSTTSAWLAKKAFVRRIPRKLSHPLCRHGLTEYDGDLVAEFVSLRQRQRVTAPELAGVEPAGVLLGGQQTHLLVGDGDGLGAVGGLQPDARCSALLR